MCVGYADNNIGDVGAQFIGDGLKSLTSLTTLNLSSECGMMYAALLCVFMCMLIECVDGINLYVCVGCTVNNIGDVGAQCIGDGLKSLTSLTTLNLSGT